MKADPPANPVPPIVETSRLDKRFGTIAAVVDVSLAVIAGELFSLLGPSGCGKTTLLRLIAGFEQPSAGRIRIAGEDLTAAPPERRPVNLVFQHAALFPHLTVGANVGFGLRYQRLSRPAAARRIGETLELVRLGGLEQRYPDQLSGGQRQRVALARALVLRPRVVLLDEPLAALDRKLRKEMQIELRALQRELGTTFLLVTHDQEEALAMSDRIAVMKDGRVEQLATPQALFERPETVFVAEFMGAGNIFAATVEALGDGRVEIAIDGGPRLALPAAADLGWARGATVAVAVRPERLTLSDGPADGPGQASLAVRIEQRLYQGATTLWTVRDEHGRQLSVVGDDRNTPGSGAGCAPGERGWLTWDPASTIPLRAR